MDAQQFQPLLQTIAATLSELERTSAYQSLSQHVGNRLSWLQSQPQNLLIYDYELIRNLSLSSDGFVERAITLLESLPQSINADSQIKQIRSLLTQKSTKQAAKILSEIEGVLNIIEPSQRISNSLNWLLGVLEQKLSEQPKTGLKITDSVLVTDDQTRSLWNIAYEQTRQLKIDHPELASKIDGYPTFVATNLLHDLKNYLSFLEEISP